VLDEKFNYVFLFSVDIDFAGIGSCRLVFYDMGVEDQCSLSVQKRHSVLKP